ncbi:MAG: hypothetical protein WCT26_02215 [Candidatus Buchananbacteria bacterium]|jgi:hypothetical protein
MKEKLKEKIVAVIVVGILAILVVGAGSFYAGTKYALAKRGGGMMGGNFQPGQGGMNPIGTAKNRQAAGASFVNGDIIAKDDKSVTIKMRDGGSKIVFFSSTCEVGKFVSGAITDLSVGNSVMINGKTNTDGSVTATSIQIRPAGEINQAGPGGAQTGQATVPAAQK